MINRLFTAAGTGLLSSALLSVGSPANAQVPDPFLEAPETSYLRVVEKPGRSISLEVAAWKFLPTDGDGPEIHLVSVAHIGDSALYRDLQRLLDSYDHVLYESVKPAGAKQPGGDTDEQRIKSTRSSLTFLAQTVELYEEEIDDYPASIQNLLVGLSTVDARLTQWVELAATDAWNNPVVFKRFDSGHAFTITSLGADGIEGGEATDADIIIHSDMAIPPHALSSNEDGMQSQLAEALGLEFQLDAIDYGQPNWQCSDMTEDEFAEALAAKGFDFAQLGGTLAGTSLPAQIVKGLLRLVKLLDSMMDGRMSDMFKIMMIEVLGDESITEHAMNTQFGEGFAEVIVGQRNQVVMNDLKRLMEEQPELSSIGIFYGAAHMKDFEERLADQIGYAPDSVVWIPAITIDLDRSALAAEEINQLRRVIRMSLGGMRK